MYFFMEVEKGVWESLKLATIVVVKEKLVKETRAFNKLATELAPNRSLETFKDATKGYPLTVESWFFVSFLKI